MLKIAFPGGKSLEERTRELFQQARIDVRRNGSSHAVSFTNSTLLSKGSFVKPRRVPFLVAEGYFDIGITGKDAVLESEAPVEVFAELPYSRTTQGSTKGVLFAHAGDAVNSIHEIADGETVISEYPNLTRKYFGTIGKNVRIVDSPGSVEAEVPMVYRFGVVLSETGRSLRDNDLKEIATLFESTTVLIANRSVFADEKKLNALRMLKLILRGVLDAQQCVMLTMNVPTENLDAVVRMLPTLQSPTITSLANGAFHAVNTVVAKAEVNNLLPQLLSSHAEGIITTPISTMIKSW